MNTSRETKMDQNGRNINDREECLDEQDETSKSSDVDLDFTPSDIINSDVNSNLSKPVFTNVSSSMADNYDACSFKSDIDSYQGVNTTLPNNLSTDMAQKTKKEKDQRNHGDVDNDETAERKYAENHYRASIKNPCGTEHGLSEKDQTCENSEHTKSRTEGNDRGIKYPSDDKDEYVNSQTSQNDENGACVQFEYVKYQDEHRGEDLKRLGKDKDDNARIMTDERRENVHQLTNVRHDTKCSENVKPKITTTCSRKIENSKGCFKTSEKKYLENYADFGLGTSDLRMVVIGKAGNGKSETANTIIGEDKFETDMCASSVTHVCQREYTMRNGRRISVVDTPGLFDVSTSNDEIAKEIANFISLTIPGPHVILFVGKIGRFTQEDQNTFDKVVEYFGESILDYCIVVFTHYDVWKRKNKDKTITDFVKSSKEWLKITQRCSDRYVALENNPDNPKNDKQVAELITMITDITQRSNNSFYSNELYIEATNKRLAEIDRERKIREEEIRLKELERKLIEDERRLLAEERKRQAEERNRQEREKERQEQERKRQIEESARLMEIERWNNKEKQRLADKKVRMKEKKYFRAEQSEIRRREEALRRQEEARYNCSVS